MCSISGFLVVDQHADRAEIARVFQAMVGRGAERGRDSAGVVAIDTNGAVRRRVEIAPRDYSFVRDAVVAHTSVAIANNRAEPTTEYVHDKTSEDAQPFGAEGVFVSHNGVIANDLDLRDRFALETATQIDTAVCAPLIARLGVRAALGELMGSYALAAIDAAHPDTLWLARNYKPLYLLLDPSLGALFFASRAQHLTSALDVASRLRAPAVIEQSPYSLLTIEADGPSISQTDLQPRGVDKRALVICSGGLDSTVAAAWAKAEGYDVTLLHFLYSCRAQEREREAVEAIGSALGCDHLFEDLDWLGRLGGSSLTDLSIPVADERGAEYAFDWVPARNLIFTALAAGLCDRHGYDTLILGLNLEEGGAYPDNTMEFFESLDHVCNIGTMSRPRILSPLGSLVKREIVELAMEYDAPVHLSWSCYHGGDLHCGHCGPCFMRKTAFAMAGHPDPVRYLS